VVSIQQLWSKHLTLWFPGVVCCGVAFPPDQVLQLAPLAEETVSHDGLDFIFCLALDHLWGRWIVIGSMFWGFMIRGQQRGVEDVMNGPGWGEPKLISDRWHLLGDDEGAMTFGGKFARLIGEG
jgi:hypothetical protein